MRITDKIDLRNCDNMELMAEYPDNYFDLAIVDPPYGIGENGSNNKTRGKLATPKNYKAFAGLDKEPAPKEYFEELFRVSKNQIIWGANHFIERINKNSSCWVVWDKNNSGDFADCELAWTSFKTAVRKFKYTWNGMLQQDMKNKEFRIHPTQKPVTLYNWLLENYAKEGDKILDTHLGSGSIAIACHYRGFELVGCELDEEYYNQMLERFEKETAQLSLLGEL
jgi:site-specific DNA-methyltransferase (adenine-specific)